jgi:ubiquinone/menaquinone biosynthesis C-methylase UbiE
MSNPAETYERDMVPALFAPWAPILIRAARPQPGERILDLACGTGIVARRVAAQLGADARISALDLNPLMLSVARNCAEREGASIDWYEGRADALPFDRASFELVLCQQGLQFFPEREAALREVRRVLVSGGRFALSLWRSLEEHPFFAAFDESVERHLGVAALAAPFSLSDANEVRGLLTGAGFRDIKVEKHTLTSQFLAEGFVEMEVDVIAAAIPSAQHLSDTERRALAAAVAHDMTPVIRKVQDGGKLHIPLDANVFSARAA